MGQKSSRSTSGILEDITRRTQNRCGSLAVKGRYHVLPKKLEDDYTSEESTCLGFGLNGNVYSVEEKHTGSSFAVKALKVSDLSRTQKKALEDECEIILSMDHPHVVRLADVYETSDQLQLVMECMKGGELFDRVKEKGTFSEQEAAEASYQMLLAVNYMHQHGIVHRDLKLENFLYESKSSNHLKLIDFGFSKFCAPDQEMTESLGTLHYVAPEVLNRKYTSQCDIWGLGVISFILLVGHMPFTSTNDQRTKEKIQSGIYNFKPQRWQKVSKEAKDFVDQLLNVDPAKRPTAAQALQHPWIIRHNSIPETPSSKKDTGVVDAMTQFGDVPALRKAIMSVAAWCLASEDDAKVRKAFLEIDRNQDGKISNEELRQYLKSKGHMEDSAVDNAFQALDVNCTHEIDYSEFLAAMFLSPMLVLHDKRLLQIFSRFDTDSSGYITRANLQEAIGQNFAGHSVEQLMQEVAFSPTHKISKGEFIDFMSCDDFSSSGDSRQTSLQDFASEKSEEHIIHEFLEAEPSLPMCHVQ